MAPRIRIPVTTPPDAVDARFPEYSHAGRNAIREVLARVDARRRAALKGTP